MAVGIPCVGVEPTASTAEAAEKIGIPVIREFFGQKLAGSMASTGRQADLVIGNNVLAHVPDINDFALGLARLLKPEGVVTLEFPHLLRLIEDCQFDTVYHEHFSYLSLTAVRKILQRAKLKSGMWRSCPPTGEACACSRLWNLAKGILVPRWNGFGPKRKRRD